MQCQRYGAVYQLGEEVEFILKSENTAGEITGTVYDSSGKKTVSIKSSAPVWKWRPERKGYYEIEFVLKTVEGKQKKIISSYKIRENEFPRERFSVGVVPALPAMHERSGLFGFSDQLEDTRLYAVAKLLGFSFSRIHAIGWGTQFSNVGSALEPERGKYNWTKLDKHIKELNHHGYEIIGNILYTPRWASPHPEKTNINICVPEFSAYAPVKDEYITDFIRVLSDRYGKDIKIWELWNEPNMPGQSCFWNDTPENFARMFKTMSSAFRKYQPDCELWIGGLGPRASYLKFYELMLGYGLHRYYDKLALHGKLTDPREFQQIDKKLGVTSKAWVNSESHDILYNQSPTVASEEQVALELIKHTLLKIKHGANKIALFSLLNLAEMESLPTYFKMGSFTHSAGLLRRRPQVEPRLAAVVYAVFTGMMERTPHIEGEYKLDNGRIHAVKINNGQKQLMLLWNTLSAPAPVPTILKDAAIIDWEGIDVGTGANIQLTPGKVYYAIYTGNLTPRLPEQQAVLVNDNDTVTDKTPETGAVLNSTAKPKFIDKGWVYVKADSSSIAEKLSAKFQLNTSERGLELQVLVNDVRHVTANEKSGEHWNYDSLQFAIDTSGRGSNSGIVEFVATETQQGPVFYKSIVPDFEGDLPSNWTMRLQEIKHGSLKITHPRPEQTLYAITVAWSELYPLVISPGKALRMSLLINNNDGMGRAGWLEWGSGIGAKKSAMDFGAIYFSKSEDILANTDGRWLAWKSADTEAVAEATGDICRIKTGKNSGVTPESIQLLRRIRLESDSSYVLSFTADSSADMIFKVCYLLAQRPWTVLSSSLCRLEKGQRDYLIKFNTGKLPPEVPLGLHMFIGQTPPDANIEIRDIRLYRLDRGQ
jgi:hypothetical protein